MKTIALVILKTGKMFAGWERNPGSTRHGDSSAAGERISKNWFMEKNGEIFTIDLFYYYYYFYGHDLRFTKIHGNLTSITHTLMQNIIILLSNPKIINILDIFSCHMTDVITSMNRKVYTSESFLEYVNSTVMFPVI